MNGELLNALIILKTLSGFSPILLETIICFMFPPSSPRRLVQSATQHTATLY